MINARRRRAFVRSGLVGLNRSSTRNLGDLGFGWSRIAKTYSSPTSANAYNLRFSIGGVSPSYGPDARWYGFPVRCLVYKFKKKKNSLLRP